VGTDRDWQADVRDTKVWINDLDKANECRHYLYRGEAIFYGTHMVRIHIITVFGNHLQVPQHDVDISR
jgi:hypothetical protein